MLFHLESVLTRKSEIPKKIPIFRTVFRNFRYWVHPYPGVKIYIFGLHRFKLVQKYHFYHCCILWVFKSTVILLWPVWMVILIWSSFTAFTFLWACKSNFPVENDNIQVENHWNTLELFNGHWKEIMVKSYRRKCQLHAECTVHATLLYSSCMCCITRVASMAKSSQKCKMYL